MIRLQLAGRFGNHLFQWATALNIENDNQSVALTYDDFHQSVPSAFLHRLATGTVEIKKSNLTGRLLQIEDKYLSRSGLLKRMIYTENNPFGVLEEVPKTSQIMRGFFQNWRNFSNIDGQIASSLSTTIDNWIISNKEIEKLIVEIGAFHAVHVRQGDYADTNFGTLSASYYQRKKSKPSHPVVVFTDAAELNDEYIRAIEPDFIFTPKQSSTEDAFALMSQAESITLANSTFSWWAGYLIAKKGGEVLIPNPWFKEGSSGDALIYPGMQSTKSIFN